jgi:steroid 5-alpha reductase family enzyme
LADMLAAYGIAVVASIAYISLVFAWAHRHGRYDVLNVVWGLACAVIALATFILNGHSTMPLLSVQTLMVVLVSIWGVRLFMHLHRQWLKRHKDDRRYRQLRKDYANKRGGLAWNMYAKVYLIQAGWALIVSMPIILVMGSDTTSIGWWAALGAVIWAIGFYFETLGDHQLRAFRENPGNKGKILDKGLWRYTRHPNYFGEMLQWWGVFIISWSVPFGWVGILGPLVITWLLVFSGIPVRERQIRRYAGWSEYRRRTSKLIPWPVRTHEAALREVDAEPEMR